MDIKARSSIGRFATAMAAFLCCLVFIGLGLAVIPYPGIQNDEALFAAPLYAPKYSQAEIQIGKKHVPIMLMTYLGTLKTWLYSPWLRHWAPSTMSVRLPVLLAGAGTVWLFYLLLLRVSGARAALAGAALLATDVSFLLTTCYDWGPVALQHLLLVSGVLLIVKFHQDGDRRAFAGGFFVLGLGLWDKSLFLWALAGLGAASLLVFPREVRRHLSGRRIVLAAFCFLLGALPLVVYNVESHGGTFGAYTSLSLKDFGNKLFVLERTLDGSVLMGYITGEDWMDHPRSPSSRLEHFSIWLHAKTGDHRRGLNWFAFLLALALIPFLWRSAAGRSLRFSAVLLLVAWLQMALTTGAGGSAHHSVLLWPFPLFLIAIAFSEISKRLPRRWGLSILATVVVAMIAQNLLVYNQHLAQFIRNGEGSAWTDAIDSLSKRLAQLGPRQIYVIDWGMLDSLRLLTKGRLLLNEASYPLNLPAPPEDGRAVLTAEISDPAHLFIAHTAEFEQFAGVGQHLTLWACQYGYARVPVASVQDRNGRAVFEIFQFEQRKDQGSQTCAAQ